MPATEAVNQLIRVGDIPYNAKLQQQHQLFGLESLLRLKQKDHAMTNESFPFRAPAANKSRTPSSDYTPEADMVAFPAIEWELSEPLASSASRNSECRDTTVSFSSRSSRNREAEESYNARMVRSISLLAPILSEMADLEARTLSRGKKRRVQEGTHPGTVSYERSRLLKMTHPKSYLPGRAWGLEATMRHYESDQFYIV